MTDDRVTSAGRPVPDAPLGSCGAYSPVERGFCRLRAKHEGDHAYRDAEAVTSDAPPALQPNVHGIGPDTDGGPNPDYVPPMCPQCLCTDSQHAADCPAVEGADAPPALCDCGAALTQCSSCAVADWQAAHPDCLTCCPVRGHALTASDAPPVLRELILSIFHMDEGEGLAPGTRLMRCRLCRRGWVAPKNRSYHHSPCVVEELERALAGAAAPLVQEDQEHEDDHARGGKWGNSQADLPRRNDGLSVG